MAPPSPPSPPPSPAGLPPGPPPTLLLTRPAEASRRFLRLLEARAGRALPAVASPATAIRPLPVALPRRPDALVLTSEAGARRAGELGLAGLPAWCVGPRTALAAAGAGLRPVEAGPDAEGLVAALLRAKPPGVLLHLRGEDARGEVASRLRAGGLPAEELVAYRAEAQPPTPAARALLDGGEAVVAPLFSPRSALLLVPWAPRAPLWVAAMSEAVAGAAAALAPARLRVAARPEAGAMAEATLALMKDAAPAPGGVA